MERNVISSDNTELFYLNRVKTLSLRIQKLRKNAKNWVVIRLVSFTTIPLAIYFLYNQSPLLLSTITLFLILLFLFFVKKSVENKDLLNFHKRLKLMNENEIKSLHNDHSAFPDGLLFIDQKHPFSYDMDVFGKKGVFPLLNRTVTIEAEKKLKDRLLNGYSNVSAFHEATEDLLNHKEWSQTFRASISNDEPAIESEIYHNWVIQKDRTPKWFKLAHFAYPITGFGSTFCYQLDIINGTQFLVIFMFSIIPVLWHVKKTNPILNALLHFEQHTKSVLKQMELLKETDFQSELMKEQKQILFEEKANAYRALKELNKLIQKSAYRHNILVGIILNFYFGWDFKIRLALNKWKNENDVNLKKWLASLTEIEVFICAMNFRYNFYESTNYPIIKPDTSKKVDIKAMGHPLIPFKKMVYNDFLLSEEQQFTIITGPNMAGKSTFLRSLGVNFMLAKAGFPVVAKHFEFPNYQLYSSMRTTDDLADESSYFHAELMRLRFIVDAVEKGEKVFIILDEILKGTNAKDKEEGSAKFLEMLIQLKCKGIIATHDLKLTELANSRKELQNMYFDTNILDDEITFDYKIRQGVAKNMNASFLLRKMGLTKASS